MNLRILREFINEVLDGFGNKSTAKGGIAGNLRYGVPTTGHTGGNVLTDEENQLPKEEEKLAATVLIIADDGKVLAVSRKDDPTQFGLPGGKVDKFEEPIDAAARELQEETGLIATDLRPVFTHKEDDGYTTTTFVGKVSGQISTREAGVIRWVDREVLFNGPFGRYNRELFATLGL